MITVTLLVMGTYKWVRTLVSKALSKRGKRGSWQKGGGATNPAALSRGLQFISRVAHQTAFHYTRLTDISEDKAVRDQVDCLTTDTAKREKQEEAAPERTMQGEPPFISRKCADLHYYYR